VIRMIGGGLSFPLVVSVRVWAARSTPSSTVVLASTSIVLRGMKKCLMGVTGATAGILTSFFGKLYFLAESCCPDSEEFILFHLCCSRSSPSTWAVGSADAGSLAALFWRNALNSDSIRE